MDIWLFLNHFLIKYNSTLNFVVFLSWNQTYLCSSNPHDSICQPGQTLCQIKCNKLHCQNVKPNLAHNTLSKICKHVLTFFRESNLEIVRLWISACSSRSFAFHSVEKLSKTRNQITSVQYLLIIASCTDRPMVLNQLAIKTSTYVLS